MRLLPLFAVVTLALACRTKDVEGETGIIEGDTGVDDPDSDDDGVPASEDCDDEDGTVFPGADELCDGLDNDCDGLTDEDDATDATTWYADADGDGYGDEAATTQACEQPEGYVAAGDSGFDCDDYDAATHPGAEEVCDGIDNDCDHELDEGVQTTWYADSDGDGFADVDTTADACEAPSGYIAAPEDDAWDCDDTSAEVNPDATEVCNELDDDCDGLVDDDDDSLDTSTASTWFDDSDGDGFGDADVTTTTCEAPSGTVADDTDCDDADAEVNPDGTEACNEVDDDCDGLVDDDDDSLDTSTASTWYDDSDGDGFGDADASTTTCEAPTGTVADDTDCDDGASSVNPDATEICNDVDDDCDGLVDDDDDTLDTSTASTWYDDSDGDGFGDADTSTLSCDAPSGTVDDDSDCDDSDGEVNPDATEVCNDPSSGAIDDDCDGLVDDEDDDLDTSTATTWYEDHDGDGWPGTVEEGGVTTSACEEPSGYVEAPDDDVWDCDDTDDAVNPGASEECDRIDNDCDGEIDWEIDALWFDASTDTVEISDDDGLALGEAFTIEAWVWWDGTTSGKVYNKWVSALEDHQLTISSGRPIGYAWKGSSTDYIKTSGTTETLTVEDWTHLAYVYDGSETRMYVDGVETDAESDTGDPWDSYGSAHIGGIYRDGRQAWPMYGFIADVRISSTARYSADFTPVDYLEADSDTQAFWALDEASGSTATDGTGFGNDGAISGASWDVALCRP